MKFYVLLSCILLTGLSMPSSLQAQFIFEGHVYESDNRGYLNQVSVKACRSDSSVIAQGQTDKDGSFEMALSERPTYLQVAKDLFHERFMSPSEAAHQDGPRSYFKVELNRKPGYLLDLSLAPVRALEDIAVDAISGARIEVYNHTTEQLLFIDEAYPSPHFSYTLTKGNHYTILIRHPDYLAKRIEAYVNVKGCILCIEGVDEMTPGVSDHLTAGHEMGTLLANIEMEPLVIGKKYEVKNLYYDFNSAALNDSAKIELDRLSFMLRNNPRLVVELGSHTDSRGDASWNLQLSQKRAESAVNYLITQGRVPHGKLSARGYGATQLVNDCAEGVNCSEEEHAKNRRTEIAIQEVRQESGVFRPLVDILEDERMQLMIDAVDEDEVIEIKEGDELPEELKRQLEKEAQERAEKEEKN